MGKSVEISSRILAEIGAEAASVADREICGLLFGHADRITSYASCANVAAEPERRFEIDPAALIAAHRAERGGGARIIGCYHSHPLGDPSPSRTDAADAVTDGWLWLIVGGGTIRGWRVVAGGERHERFDPVDLRPIDGM